MRRSTPRSARSTADGARPGISGGLAGNTAAASRCWACARASSARSPTTQLGEVYAHDVSSIGVEVHHPGGGPQSGAPTARSLVLVTPTRKDDEHLPRRRPEPQQRGARRAQLRRADSYLEGYLWDPEVPRRRWSGRSRSPRAPEAQSLQLLSTVLRRSAIATVQRTDRQRPVDILFATRRNRLAGPARILSTRGDGRGGAGEVLSFTRSEKGPSPSRRRAVRGSRRAGRAIVDTTARRPFRGRLPDGRAQGRSNLEASGCGRSPRRRSSPITAPGSRLKALVAKRLG